MLSGIAWQGERFHCPLGLAALQALKAFCIYTRSMESHALVVLSDVNQTVGGSISCTEGCSRATQCQRQAMLPCTPCFSKEMRPNYERLALNRPSC